MRSRMTVGIEVTTPKLIGTLVVVVILGTRPPLEGSDLTLWLQLCQEADPELTARSCMRAGSETVKPVLDRA